MKKFKFALIGILVAGVFTACTATEDYTPEDAQSAATPVAVPEGAEVFTGSARGFGGTLTVEVTVYDGEVMGIEVVSHSESTHLIYQPAFDRVISSVLNDGNLNIDNVSGATLSFVAVNMAVREALTEAGIDVQAMMLPRAEHIPQVIEMEADVVIIGGGGAGLSAAVVASRLGSDVIIVERNSILGGNSLLAGSIMQASGTPQQEALGIEDSPDLHFQHTMEAGDNANRAELTRILADNARDAMLWMEEMGTQWSDQVFVGAGTTFPRAHSPAVGALGTGWIEPVQRFAEDPENNIEIILDARATEIIMENGRAVGVLATGRNGDEFILTANSGVIISTGGFSANVEMRLEHDIVWGGRLDASIPTTNFPSIQGDGIVMAQDVGANVIDMGYVQLLPLGDRSGNTSNFTGGFGFFINEQGLRFTDENGRRDDMTADLFEQTNARMFMLTDLIGLEGALHGNLDDLDRIVYYGYAYRAGSIPELAEMLDIDPDVLMNTISEFNEMAAGERECPFGRDFAAFPGGAINLEAEAFIANPRVPTVHHTMGGVEIDTYTRVIDVEGNVIPGLYAAGEVVGGVHGTNRLGGNAIAEAFVFGRIAGESAALGQ